MNLNKTQGLVAKKGKKIWTEEEDKALIRILKEKEELNWNEIAAELKKEGYNNKTGKQCRERYRNYADPVLDKSEWKPQEKLLFLVLHRIYDNQWCNISRYLTQRSDIAIKNYFYSVIRKTLKYYKTRSVPHSVILKPMKFYQIYNTLELLRNEYMAVLCETSIKEPAKHKEKIILRLLKERKATKETLDAYAALLTQKFTDFHTPKSLPVKIQVNLPVLGISGVQAEELLARESLCNTAPLSQMVVIQIQASTVSPEPVKTAQSTSPASTEHQLLENGLFALPYMLPLPYHMPRPYYYVYPPSSFQPVPTTQSPEPEKKLKREY